MYKNGRKKTVFNEFLHAFADGFAPKLVQQSEISGQRSEIRDQRSVVSGQRSEIRDQWSVVSFQLPALSAPVSGGLLPIPGERILACFARVDGLPWTETSFFSWRFAICGANYPEPANPARGLFMFQPHPFLHSIHIHLSV
jgi:hypothetical protein